MVHPSVGSTAHPAHAQSGADAVPSPSLHRALGTLMVNLDDELLRYRHSRTGQGPKPVPQRKLAFRPKPRSSPSLMQFGPADRRQGQAAPKPTVPTTAAPQVSSRPKPTDSGHPHACPKPPAAGAGPQVGAPIPPYGTGTALGSPLPSPITTGSTLSPYTATPDAYLESTAALLDSAPSASDPTDYLETFYPETYYHGEANARLSLGQRLSTPLGVGALLLLLVGSAGLGYLITSPTAIDHLRNQAGWQRPQAAPEADDVPPSETVGEVPTGLQGIGPDLSGQEFDSLDLDRVSRLPAEASDRPSSAVNAMDAPTADRSNGSAPAPTSAPSAGEAEIPNSRPQPSDALRPSGTLRTETVAPLPSGRSAPTTVAPSAVAPRSARPVTPSAARSSSPAPDSQAAPPQPPRAVSPSPAASVAPPPRAMPPQPLGTVTTAPTPTPTLPTAPPPPLAPSSSTPATRSNYYVVTDYTGQPSLESARGVVSDAYVRNFQGSAKIQMGAFSQESSARQMMQQLQQQGIPAQVYNSP